MVAGANGDARIVQYGGGVVRMHPVDIKADDPGAVRRPVQGHSADRLQRRAAVGDQRILVRVNGVVKTNAGHTNLGDPLDAAREMLQTQGRSDVPDIIIFMTDGEANQPDGLQPCSYLNNKAAIAKAAGADVEPQEYRPVLRAMLLTGSSPRYLRHAPHDRGIAVDEAPWWPPHKIAGRELAPYLTANPELLLDPIPS